MTSQVMELTGMDQYQLHLLKLLKYVKTIDPDRMQSLSRFSPPHDASINDVIDLSTRSRAVIKFLQQV